VIALTKTKKRTKDQKDTLIEEIRETTDKFSRCYLLDMDNERNEFLQEVRKKMRPGVMFAAKNKQMQVALGMTPEEEAQDGIHQVAERITGRCVLLFTEKAPAEVQSFLAGFRPSSFARNGALASQTVVLPRGVDALAKMPHSIEEHLRKCGLPTQLLDGKIHLLGDYTVCKEGGRLSSDAAQILKLLEIKMAQFSLTVVAHWTKGGKFVDCEELED